jgi:hypothetical protein
LKSAGARAQTATSTAAAAESGQRCDQNDTRKRRDHPHAQQDTSRTVSTRVIQNAERAL